MVLWMLGLNGSDHVSQNLMLFSIFYCSGTAIIALPENLNNVEIFLGR
jgi:hypothetical protein